MEQRSINRELGGFLAEPAVIEVRLPDIIVNVLRNAAVEQHLRVHEVQRDAVAAVVGAVGDVARTSIALPGAELTRKPDRDDGTWRSRRSRYGNQGIEKVARPRIDHVLLGPRPRHLDVCVVAPVAQAETAAEAAVGAEVIDLLRIARHAIRHDERRKIIDSGGAPCGWPKRTAVRHSGSRVAKRATSAGSGTDILDRVAELVRLEAQVVDIFLT